MRPRRIRDMTPKRMQGSRGKQSFPVPGPSDLTPAAALCNGQTLTEKGGPRVRMNVEVGLLKLVPTRKQARGRSWASGAAAKDVGLRPGQRQARVVRGQGAEGRRTLGWTWGWRRRAEAGASGVFLPKAGERGRSASPGETANAPGFRKAAAT